MTIEVFPDSPTRISFSYDLSQSEDAVPVEEYIRTTSSSTIDFDFCVFRESFAHESSTADELFYNGQILPIEIKRRLTPPPPPPPSKAEERPPPLPLPQMRVPPPNPPRKSRNSVDLKNSGSAAGGVDSPDEKPKSFWRFKRSSSLNCGSGYGRTLCPLPLLSRSNSTGSAGGVKRSTVANNPKQSFLRNGHQPPSKQNQSAPYSAKPPLNRSAYGFNGVANGVKFNPVLHVPSANLFGFGSIFSIGGAGKDRSRKKN